VVVVMLVVAMAIPARCDPGPNPSRDALEDLYHSTAGTYWFQATNCTLSNHTNETDACARVWLDPWYQPCYPYSLARSRSLSFKGSLETHVPMVGGSVSLAMITSSIKCTFKRSIVYMVQPRQSHLSTQPRARVRVRVYVISLVICHITISRAPWYVPHGLSIKRASDLSISCWPQLSLALFLTLLITNASSNKPIHLHLFDRIRMRGCSLHLSATSQA